MLVLSGHGGGTSEDFLLKDQNAQNALSMEELREALDNASPTCRHGSDEQYRKFDILGFDACFMSMGEVALRFATMPIFSSALRGWSPPSDGHIAGILKRSRWRDSHIRRATNWPATSSRSTSTHYHDYDRTAGRSADLSAVKVGELEPGVECLHRAGRRPEESERRRSMTSSCWPIGTRRPTSPISMST